MQKTKQKNAMWVKTEDSTLFEEAYFLLKEKAAPLGDSEMVKEANRIIAAFESKGLPQKKKRAADQISLFLFPVRDGLRSAFFRILRFFVEYFTLIHGKFICYG